jgi:hypothetical protein
MGEISVVADGPVGAPPDVVYGYLENFRDHHPHFLPSAFKDFRLVEGGVGAGTVFTTRSEAGGRTRNFRMRVDTPEPGCVMTESDLDSSMVTTFTVTPEGSGSRVQIASRWQGAGGIGGFFERLFAPRVLRRLFTEEIGLLDQYAREHAAKA